MVFPNVFWWFLWGLFDVFVQLELWFKYENNSGSWSSLRWTKGAMWLWFCPFQGAGSNAAQLQWQSGEQPPTAPDTVHCWRVAAKKSFLEPVFDIIWSYLVWLVGWLVGGFKKKIERHQGSSWQKRLNIAKPPLWHQAFQTGGLWQRLHQRLRNIPGLKVCSQQHILLIKHSNEKDLFKHLRTRPNVRPCPQILRQYNVMFLSPKDERKHWLYAVILTLCLQDWGFRVYNLMVLGFRL